MWPVLLKNQHVSSKDIKWLHRNMGYKYPGSLQSFVRDVPLATVKLNSPRGSLKQYFARWEFVQYGPMCAMIPCSNNISSQQNIIKSTMLFVCQQYQMIDVNVIARNKQKHCCLLARKRMPSILPAHQMLTWCLGKFPVPSKFASYHKSMHQVIHICIPSRIAQFN